jgi:hypothetical protein
VWRLRVEKVVTEVYGLDCAQRGKAHVVKLCGCRYYVHENI